MVQQPVPAPAPEEPMAADASTTAAAAVAPREFELPEVTFPPHLILSQAVVMASAAMEAYLEPTTGQQFRNLGGNGTTVQYLDDAFVKAALGALLQVTVKNAKGFSDVDVRCVLRAVMCGSDPVVWVMRAVLMRAVCCDSDLVWVKPMVLLPTAHCAGIGTEAATMLCTMLLPQNTWRR